MSSTFRAFLNETGYKSPSKETNLDWVFTSSDTIKNFLLWLAANVQRSNVLTTEEINEYVTIADLPLTILQIRTITSRRQSIRGIFLY
jgi:hypothetical protein